MICLLCKKIEVQDPKAKICDLCRIELEMAFTYYIGGQEVTREEYNRRIQNG